VAAGLTQGELAERAHLSKRGIADLERGRRQAPRKETVALLAVALGLGADERARFEAGIRRHRTPLPRQVNDLSEPLRPIQAPEGVVLDVVQALGVLDSGLLSLSRCSFCGKRQEQVVLLISGTGGFAICDACVERAHVIVQERHQRADPPDA
jgi:transcriptional regulator with XRE-family HTH domain